MGEVNTRIGRLTNAVLKQVMGLCEGCTPRTVRNAIAEELPHNGTCWKCGCVTEMAFKSGEPVCVDCAKQLVNEAVILRAQNAELLEALKGLRRGDCFCGISIGDPTMTDHSPQCVAAIRAIGEG